MQIGPDREKCNRAASQCENSSDLSGIKLWNNESLYALDGQASEVCTYVGGFHVNEYSDLSLKDFPSWLWYSTAKVAHHIS